MSTSIANSVHLSDWQITAIVKDEGVNKALKSTFHIIDSINEKA